MGRRDDNGWLESLLEASYIVNSSLELDEVLRLILETLRRVVVYDSASIQRITRQGLKIVACQGHPHAGRLIGRVFPSSNAYPNYRVWQEKLPLIERDMKTTYQSQIVRGWLGVPLLYKDRAIGVITLDSQTPDFYTEEDARIAAIFANQAAIAMENARLYAKETERASTLRAMLDVEREMTQNITTQSKVLLDKIARTACQVTGADCAVIYPYLADSGKYDLANLGAYGLEGELTQQDKKRLADGEGVSSVVLQKGHLIIHNVAQDDPRLRQHNFIKRENIEAFISIRLDATETVGILFVNYRRPHRWRKEEVSIIELFASQAAMAILNARLFGRTNQRLERKVAELKTLVEINQLITATLDLDAVLTLIMSKAMELVNAQNVELQLIDEETGELVIQQAQGPMTVPEEQRRLKLGQGITGTAAQKKYPIVVEDVTRPPWNDIYREFRPNIRSELAVPLLVEQACIGVLNFEHPQPGYFSRDKCEIVEALAAQAAIAIQNARRYDELERTRDNLAATEAIAWIGLFGSSWAQGLTQKTAALRNYLAVLADYLPPDEKATALFDRIEGVVHSIQSIPPAQPLPSKPKKTSAIDLDETLQAQVKRWGQNRPDVALIFDLNCGAVRVRIDEQWLEVAMEKLVDNALKAMPGGGDLTIATKPLRDQVDIRVIDTGQGIADSVKPFFLKQQIPKKFTSVGGSGIGMLIARYIFRAFEGDLELLWSEAGRGTALRAKLPAVSVADPNQS